MEFLSKKTWLLIALLWVAISSSAYDFEVDGIYYSVISLENLTCEVAKGDEKYEGDFTIPAEVTYNTRTLSVTAIGEEAFQGCISLQSVTIPNSVTEIKAEAFGSCSSLQSISISNSVTAIGESAFYHCSSLQSVTIPNSVTTIRSGAFSYCGSLESIKLSDSLKYISSELFENCRSLKALEIPGSVEYIEQTNTFRYCSNLENLSLLYSTDGVLYLRYFGAKDDSWGYWTKTIKELYIDRNLDIDISVPNLEKLEIGEHMETIQVENLNKLQNLTTIECYALIPPKLPEMTNAHYLNMNVFVPAEALETYKADPTWGKFWNLQAAGIESVNEDFTKTVIARYDLSGTPVDEDYKGFVIVRFSDGSTKKIMQ